MEILNFHVHDSIDIVLMLYLKIFHSLGDDTNESPPTVKRYNFARHLHIYGLNKVDFIQHAV